MTSLRNLFHKPAAHPIGGVDFVVFKIAFDQFDDALTLGVWLNTLEETSFSIEQLNAIKAGTPERSALERLLAGCLAVAELPDSEGLTKLQPSDVAGMPVPMVSTCACTRSPSSGSTGPRA